MRLTLCRCADRPLRPLLLTIGTRPTRTSGAGADGDESEEEEPLLLPSPAVNRQYMGNGQRRSP